MDFGNRGSRGNENFTLNDFELLKKINSEFHYIVDTWLVDDLCLHIQT